MEMLTIVGFCLVLIVCVIFKIPILWALSIGLGIFIIYGIKKGFSISAIRDMCWKSILTVHTILITFFLIGMLTASWRACGTIAVIITQATAFISPESFIVTVFLLNAFVSFLIGTSFGTVATVGVICITMAQTLELDTFWTAGAIISGIYFGDRCSPVSTSALLVSTLTETDLYQNVKFMLKTCALPFLITCSIYYFVGSNLQTAKAGLDIRAMFGKSFNLDLVCLLPAATIFSLALVRVNVKKAMSISIITAVFIGAYLQGLTIEELCQILFMGYVSENYELGKMLNGGGIYSMLQPAAIVCIASCYSGIFQGTGLLTGIKKGICLIEEKSGTFISVLIAAILTGVIACNQTLNIMLTHQLCKDLNISKQELAVNLEDTAVVISPIIPWNIAGAVPIATIGASPVIILAACYLYLIPVCRLIVKASGKL